MKVLNRLSWVTLWGLAGGVWLASVALPPQVSLWSDIAPQTVQAYTERFNVILTHQADESYAAFLSRAESAARAMVQRIFDRDVLITEASVIVTAQTDAAAAPILAINVSRNQWKNRPDPQRWATYFRASKALLGFEKPIAKPAIVTPSPAASATAPTPGGVPGSMPNPGNQPTPNNSTPPATANPSPQAPVAPPSSPDSVPVPTPSTLPAPST